MRCSYIQTISWWDYHWLILLTPLSLLGAMGVDLFIKVLKGFPGKKMIRATVLVFLMIVSIPVVRGMAKVIGDMGESVRALQLKNRQAYHEGIHSRYQDIREESAFLLKPEALPGSIYLFGTPVIYLLTNREQASGIQGWPVDTITGKIFDRIAMQLEENLPVYIFIEYSPHAGILRGILSIQELITAHYQLDHYGQMGVWYRLKY